MLLENLSEGLSPDWARRLLDFEAFIPWTERRVAPVAHRAARAAMAVQALAAIGLMTAALGVKEPKA